jgi:salicylate hydroxylase
LIFDLAVREGVTVKFNSLVVDADPQLGFVKLRTGERLYADVIIGADGYDSILRPFVTEFDDFRDQDMHLFLNFIVPVDLLRADKDLRNLVDPRVVCPSLLSMSMIMH